MHVLQRALDTEAEARLVQIEFSAAFDRVTELRDKGFGGNIILIVEQFLMSRTQRVKIYGSFSEYVSVVSGVP